MTKIFYPSLKKCLICSLLFSCLYQDAHAKAIPARSKDLTSTLKKELTNQNTVSFSTLLKKWKKKYGSQAVPALVRLSKDKKLKESHRYIALMGFARLGGKATSKHLVQLLKDRSWMVRSGALKALGALKTKKSGKAILPLLKDPALVVRSEAVKTVRILKPKGSVSALVSVLRDPTNFHGGKAQWVPYRALEALLELKPPKKTAKFLLPLLKLKSDRRFQQTTAAALSTITGKKPKRKLTPKKEILFWEKQIKAL